MRGGRHARHCGAGSGGANIAPPLLLLAACLLCFGSASSEPALAAVSSLEPASMSAYPEGHRVLAPAAMSGYKAGTRRRLLQVSAAAAAAATSSVGDSSSANSTVVAEARKGSVAASEIFKPGELTEGEKIEVIVLQYRAEGPQMSPINAQLKQAFSQTFTVLFSLFDLEADVTVVPAQPAPLYIADVNGTSSRAGASSNATAGGRTAAGSSLASSVPRVAPPPARVMGRRLLAAPPQAAGSSNTSRSSGGGSNSTASSLAAQGSLSNFTAVDVNVTLYATIDSFFTRLGQKQFIESAVLSNSMQTLGYSNVTFLATALSVPASAVPVVVRLPPSLLQTATEFILAVVQFSGSGAVPVGVEEQTALLDAITVATPSLINSMVLSVNQTAADSTSATVSVLVQVEPANSTATADINGTAAAPSAAAAGSTATPSTTAAAATSTLTAKTMAAAVSTATADTTAVANSTASAAAASPAASAAAAEAAASSLQDFVQSFGGSVGATMAGFGVPGNVRLLSARNAPELNPYNSLFLEIANGGANRPLTIIGAPPPPPGTAIPASSGGSGMSAGAIAGIAVAVALAVALIVIIACVCSVRKKRRRKAAEAAAAEARYKALAAKLPRDMTDSACSSLPGSLRAQFGDVDEKGMAPAQRDLLLKGWAIPHAEIQICKKDDGTDWLLGAGSYGKVFKALRGGVQDVAVKQLLHTEDGQLENFMEEVGILKSLNYDRNIVQFYGACLQEGSDPMLVCEFMEGGDLCAALQEDVDGELSWYIKGHQIALDIARGLFFLHSHGVMHSDLKTKNVLLTKDGVTAKIADVGLSQFLDHQQDQPNIIAWTFAYAAPEAIIGETCTLKSDIYSFGVVLLEIVTGVMPVTRGQTTQPVVPDDCPEDIWTLIKDCTASDPDQRPTAKECFERLKASCEEHVALEGGLTRYASGISWATEQSWLNASGGSLDSASYMEGLAPSGMLARRSGSAPLNRCLSSGSGRSMRRGSGSLSDSSGAGSAGGRSARRPTPTEALLAAAGGSRLRSASGSNEDVVDEMLFVRPTPPGGTRRMSHDARSLSVGRASTRRMTGGGPPSSRRSMSSAPPGGTRRMSAARMGAPPGSTRRMSAAGSAASSRRGSAASRASGGAQAATLAAGYRALARQDIQQAGSATGSGRLGTIDSGEAAAAAEATYGRPSARAAPPAEQDIQSCAAVIGAAAAASTAAGAAEATTGSATLPAIPDSPFADAASMASVTLPNGSSSGAPAANNPFAQVAAARRGSAASNASSAAGAQSPGRPAPVAQAGTQGGATAAAAAAGKVSARSGTLSKLSGASSGSGRAEKTPSISDTYALFTAVEAAGVQRNSVVVAGDLAVDSRLPGASASFYARRLTRESMSDMYSSFDDSALPTAAAAAAASRPGSGSGLACPSMSNLYADFTRLSGGSLGRSSGGSFSRSSGSRTEFSRLSGRVSKPSSGIMQACKGGANAPDASARKQEAERKQDAHKKQEAAFPAAPDVRALARAAAAEAAEADEAAGRTQPTAAPQLPPGASAAAAAVAAVDDSTASGTRGTQLSQTRVESASPPITPLAKAKLQAAAEDFRRHSGSGPAPARYSKSGGTLLYVDVAAELDHREAAGRQAAAHAAAVAAVRRQRSLAARKAAAEAVAVAAHASEGNSASAQLAAPGSPTSPTGRSVRRPSASFRGGANILERVPSIAATAEQLYAQFLERTSTSPSALAAAGDAAAQSVAQSAAAPAALPSPALSTASSGGCATGGGVIPAPASPPASALAVAPESAPQLASTPPLPPPLVETAPASQHQPQRQQQPPSPPPLGKRASFVSVADLERALLERARGGRFK